MSVCYEPGLGGGGGARHVRVRDNEHGGADMPGSATEYHGGWCELESGECRDFEVRSQSLPCLVAAVKHCTIKPSLNSDSLRMSLRSIYSSANSLSLLWRRWWNKRGGSQSSLSRLLTSSLTDGFYLLRRPPVAHGG